MRQNIFNKFKETIDLSEFVISGMNNLSLFIHNSQIDQKRNRNTFFKNILFHPVMCLDLNFFFLFMVFLFNSHFPLFTDKNNPVCYCTLCLKLSEILCKFFFHIFNQFRTPVVCMQNFLSFCGRCLLTDLSFQPDRTNLYF